MITAMFFGIKSKIKQEHEPPSIIIDCGKETHQALSEHLSDDGTLLVFRDNESEGVYCHYSFLMKGDMNFVRVSMTLNPHVSRGYCDPLFD